MQSICSIAAAILTLVSTADAKTLAGWHATSGHPQAAGYKLPRLPPLPRLPKLPRP